LPQTAWHWALASLVSKAVILVRPSRGWLSVPSSAGAVALLFLNQWGVLPLGPWATLAVVAACIAGWAALSFIGTPGPGRRHLEFLLTISGLWIAFHGTCELPRGVYFVSDMMIAGLVITAHLVRRWGGRLGSAWLLLQCLGLVVAGWSTLAWTVHRLEWHVLYGFFGAGFVEEYVFAFMPLVIARYCLPLVMIRRLLADFEPPEQSSATGVWFAVAAKLCVALALLVGMGAYDAFNEEYLEAAQHVGVIGALALALAYEPPRRAEAGPPAVVAHVTAA
jgi:hypothetical protein